LCTVNFQCYPSEPAIKLSKGWNQFVEENELQPGDVCQRARCCDKDIIIVIMGRFIALYYVTNWVNILLMFVTCCFVCLVLH
jgi:hypothetical protein